MRLIANSVFPLPDGSRAVPGAEISADSELCAEWVSKGFAYFVPDEDTPVFKRLSEENDEDNPIFELLSEKNNEDIPTPASSTPKKAFSARNKTAEKSAKKQVKK